MADFCTDFETGLKSDSATTALIGSGTAARLYPDEEKQGAALPHAVYAEVGGESVGHLRGRGGLCLAVIGVYAYGATRLAANELAETIKVFLCPKDLPSRRTFGNTHISSITCASHRVCGVDRPQDNSDTRKYWTYRVYDIWHQES